MPGDYALVTKLREGEPFPDAPKGMSPSVAASQSYNQTTCIRPFTVGRKNWLFCDTPGGAHASAAVYTMVEMAKAHGLNVEKYLIFLLEKRPYAGMADEELEKLAPWSDEARAYCGFAQQIACI